MENYLHPENVAIVTGTQERMWRLIDEVYDMGDVVAIMEEECMNDPETLRAVLINYYMFSDFMRKLSACSEGSLDVMKVLSSMRDADN